jgi:putative membrane protein
VVTMKTNIQTAMHALLRAALTGGFSYYIYYLVKTDKLLYFIAPRMENIVKLSAVALALIAVYLCFAAVWALRGGISVGCGCGHGPKKAPLRNTIAYALFAAPLLFGWFVPDSIMGSNVVDKKGIVLSSGTAVSGLRSLKEAPPEQGGLFYAEDSYTKQYASFAEKLYLQNPIRIEEATYLEASTAIDLFMKPFQGKSIEIGGFVYRQDDMTPTQFVVARLAMDCCSADSTPYGFLVEWPEAGALPEDTWVTVEGTIGASRYGDMEIVTIQATAVEPMPMPATPYVYPNYDVLNE